MKTKWNIEFFVKIGLVPSKWLFYNKLWKNYSLEDYLDREMKRNKDGYKKVIKAYKEQGKVYFTKARLKKMDYAFSR